jgi:holo-[acyl-carrier protein] synthase
MLRVPLVGIDLTEPSRLRDRLARNPELAAELFHPGEQAYCMAEHDPAQHLAARFSAKEAVVKALGLDGFDPLDVEILEGGERCDVRLHGDAAARADQLGVVVTISLTHLPAMAGAVALALPAGARDGSVSGLATPPALRAPEP